MFSQLLRLAVRVFLLCGLALPAAAEDLIQIYNQAVEFDPVVRASEHEFNATEEAIVQARSGLLPSISLDANRTSNYQKILKTQNAVFAAGNTRFRNSEYTLTATQPIFNQAAWKRLAQSKASVKQAYVVRVAAEQDLILRTSAAYLTVLAARDGLDFVATEKEAVAHELELAEAKYSSGLGTVTGYYDAKARLALNQARQLEAESQLDDARQAMKEITNGTVLHYMYLGEDIPLVMPAGEGVELWVKTALEQNFSIEAKRQAVEVARQEIAKQKAGHYPVVDLVGTHNFKDTGSTLYGGGSEIETDVVMLRLSVPIFQGGGTASLVREAVERHLKAREELEQEIRKIERQTRSAYLGVLNSISKVMSLSESLRYQQSAVEAREAGYRSGVYTIVAVLDAQRDLYAAKRDHAQARYDYLVNRMLLKQSVGALGSDDLYGLNDLLVNEPVNEDMALRKLSEPMALN